MLGVVHPSSCPYFIVINPSRFSHSLTAFIYPIKAFGDGSFGMVWLCDWHGALPANRPTSKMQAVVGSRPEYANMQLVAVKHMKRKWEGWDECRRVKELKVHANSASSARPSNVLTLLVHKTGITCNTPSFIPLYDSFLLPESKELYFVFEPMKGHLCQHIKSHHGCRPFADGLVALIFCQIVQCLRVYITSMPQVTPTRHEAQKYSCDHHWASLIPKFVFTCPT
jgi:serine/threonine protein kinase